MITPLKNFVDMRTDSNFSCFLDTILYKDRNSSKHHEKTNSLSCAFCGFLKVGSLRFHTTQVNLLMGDQFGLNTKFQSSLQLIGTFSESADFKSEIFKRYPANCMNVRFFFAQNTPGYIGSFCAICNVFGIEKLVNVRISHENIKFKLRGKMYNRFDASMNCSSRILPWENQIFDVDGRFERNTGETDFVATLQKELENYAKKSISQAMKRKEAGNRAVERARIRLEKVLSFKKFSLNEFARVHGAYMLAQEHYDAAKETMKSIEIHLKEYSKDIEDIKLHLDSLCNIKHCKKVCQEDIICNTCHKHITEKSVCPATCFRIEQRRIPPYSEATFCKRESCKRITSTDGLFKRLLGETIARSVKSTLSFALTATSTVLSAPPSVTSAFGNAVTTLSGTEEADKIDCSLLEDYSLGAIGGKVLLSEYCVNEHLTAEGTSSVRNGAFSKAISWEGRQKDGHWKCKDVAVKCNKRTYQYEYKHHPYECKQSCINGKSRKAFNKICCKSVSCDLEMANITCVLENAICRKARVDALERISKSKSEAIKMLQKLGCARSNVSYWSIQVQKRFMLAYMQTKHRTTQESVHIHEKAYKSAIESQNKLEKLLSKPLKIISLFKQNLTSDYGVKLKDIYFKTKVHPGYDNTVLPIFITFEVGRIVRQLSTAFDFKQISASLKRASQEILADISANVFRSSSRKRSIDIPVSQPDFLLSSLKKYHSYCATFTNYHDILYGVADSLRKLSSERLLMQNTLSQSNHLATNNITNLITSTQFSLAECNYSLKDSVKNDSLLLEAFQFQQKVMQQNYDWLNYTSKLLIYNWFATTEEMFNTSSMNYECSGMSDCLIYILDRLVQILAVTEADGANHIRQQVKNLDIQLDYLSNSTDATIEDGMKISSEIFDILDKMKGVDVFCAKPPNISKQPEPITEIGIGKVLVLSCNASGTALQYSWTLNGKILEDQETNMLTISNTTLSYSGNYTCIVCNHIARQKSTPAFVIIHPPPIIIKQPVEYLAAVLFDGDFLQCKVEETSNNVSYHWWFKPVNSPSSFAPLPNETFPYLNFSPMKPKDEGWYFCQVSNPYGVTTSRISFVRLLSFTLPVPTATLSFTLDRRTEKNNSIVQWPNFKGYSTLRSHIMKHMLLRYNHSEAVRAANLKPINCLNLGKTNNECNDIIGICSWEFKYIGKNVTSNNTIRNDFKLNAGLVVNATQELSDTIERFVNGTDTGILSFTLDGSVYFSKRNSVSIHKYLLICPRNQVLLQKDLKCGKLYFLQKVI